ncbi:hypothetical protein [Nitratireductor sp. ZSWI3]|uniref:hypothetical protein n=1 Tax=Nitratireductor sp. ZSWI3 TaxID=2966359 RepID=UPI00214F90CB|nr:hypothetical protein [Nitratireductor sp. ZSWI3]MCR4269276.1 hypothetical protein [Nitratireductor sp. ZSWI3]
MLTLMKILHFFGLMLGAAGGMGGMMVAIQAKRSGGTPAAGLMALRPRFTMITLTGVALLWLTGLWMWLVSYDGAFLSAAFVAKLLAAAFILAVSVAAFVAVRRAQPGTPPPALLQRLGPLAGLASYLAVALAVYVFG